MKQRLEELKQQFVNARTEQERQVVVSSIRQMIDNNAEEVAEWTLQQARSANQKADELLGRSRYKIIHTMERAKLTIEEYIEQHGFKLDILTEDELEQVRQEVEALNNGLFLLDGILDDPDIRMRSWLKDDK